MAILLDHQLQEQIPHDISAFPVAFYRDELAALPGRTGPVHWHPYFEIAAAQSGVLDYQVGQIHTILEPGDSISSTRICSTEFDSCPAPRRILCRPFSFPAQWSPRKTAPFTRNTFSRFSRAAPCPLLCSGTTTFSGERSMGRSAPRTAPCGICPPAVS